MFKIVSLVRMRLCFVKVYGIFIGIRGYVVLVHCLLYAIFSIIRPEGCIIVCGWLRLKAVEVFIIIIIEFLLLIERFILLILHNITNYEIY